MGLGQAQSQVCQGGNCTSAQVSLQSEGAAYMRLEWPIGRFQPYMRVGAAVTRLQTALSATQALNQSERSAAIGAGIGLHLDAKRQIYLDVQHLKAHGASVDIMGLGYMQRFGFSGRY